jgi:MEDS: MEthanogen/methylotroph, DcmR Sensory domain
VIISILLIIYSTFLVLAGLNYAPCIGLKRRGTSFSSMITTHSWWTGQHARSLEASLVGNPSVLVGTPSHLGGIEQQLLASGFDLEVLRRAGRYVVLDAAATLSQLLVGDWPDDKKFDEIIGKVVRKASAQSPDRFVFVFGEMVGLLCSSGQPAAAIRLEQLWNALAQSIRFSLWCTYPLQSFDDNPDLDLLMQICAEHSLMVPADNLA